MPAKCHGFAQVSAVREFDMGRGMPDSKPKKRKKKKSVLLEAAPLSEKLAFCEEVASLKTRAGELGLIKTMHALEQGVTAVGWEVAEHMEKT